MKRTHNEKAWEGKYFVLELNPKKTAPDVRPFSCTTKAHSWTKKEDDNGIGMGTGGEEHQFKRNSTPDLRTRKDNPELLMRRYYSFYFFVLYACTNEEETKRYDGCLAVDSLRAWNEKQNQQFIYLHSVLLFALINTGSWPPV